MSKNLSHLFAPSYFISYVVLFSFIFIITDLDFWGVSGERVSIYGLFVSVSEEFGPHCRFKNIAYVVTKIIKMADSLSAECIAWF